MNRLPHRAALQFVLALLCGTAFALAAETRLNRIGQLLTKEEYNQAGLNKLTPEELAALETALSRHGMLPPADGATATTSPRAARSTSPAGADATYGAEQVNRERPADTTSELRSRIEGTLHEISGRAVFVLENGQVWQQRIPNSVFFPRKLVNPEVVISRGLGGYKMTIVPANCVLFVKRIQ